MAAAGSQLLLLPSTRAGEISLMAGVVMAFFPSRFTPGGWRISPMHQIDYAETLEMLSRYSSLAHGTARTAVVSMLLCGYGLGGLRPIAGSKLSSFLQYGIITGLFVIGAAGLINFGAAQNFPAIALDQLLKVNNSLLSVGALCLFIVGVGMYRRRRELSPDEPAD